MNNLFRLIVVGGVVVLAVLGIAVGMARNTAHLMAPINLLFFLVLVGLYLLPTGLALYRDCKAIVWITMVNVFLGWTMFGWVVAIGWAAAGKADTRTPTITAPPNPVLHGR
jgi:lysylphosphatidylglycerol synthetase-like protein (DUF2156 family)